MSKLHQLATTSLDKVSTAASRRRPEIGSTFAMFGPQGRIVRGILLHDPKPEQDDEVIRRLNLLVCEMSITGNDVADPMREVFARLGDKWSTLLLILLEMRPMRFNMLNDLVNIVSAEGAISRRILARSLRALEFDGFIARDDRSIGKQLWTSYSLTPLGRDFVATFRKLLDWTRSHLDEIYRARADFIERHK